jgi:hypothetical protein
VSPLPNLTTPCETLALPWNFEISGKSSLFNAPDTDET